MSEAHTWQLDQKELAAVYDGNVGDYIKSGICIETPLTDENSWDSCSHRITWNLCLYPTGNDHLTAQFAYFTIHTRSIPPHITNIFVQYTVTLQEMNQIWSQNHVNINNKHLLHTLQSESPLNSQQLKQCESITFKITIKIVEIVYKRNKRAEPPPNNNNNTTTEHIHRYNNYKSTTQTPQPLDTSISEHDSDDDALLVGLHTHRTYGGTPGGDIVDEYKEEDMVEDVRRTECECYPQGIMPTFDHCVKWTIRAKEFGRFMHSENGRSRDTNWFRIEQFKFKLSVFPNGHKDGWQGFVIVYLDIDRMPDHMRNIRIHWCFSCLQTGTRATSMKDLNNKRLGTMLWLPNALKLSDFDNMHPARVTFVLELNIFGIEYYSVPINAQFQHLLQYNSNKKYLAIHDKQFAHESCTMIWKLHDLLLRGIKKSHMDQSFDSAQFDIWIIRLVPKGTYEMKDKFVLSLKLLPYYLDLDIVGIVARIVFECHQLNIEWNDIATFTRKGSAHRFSNKFDISHILKWEDLCALEHNAEPITFEFTVKILNLFGPHNKEIEANERHKYLKKASDANNNDNDQNDNVEFDKWNLLRMIKELQIELRQTRTELMKLKQGRKEEDEMKEIEETKEENDVNSAMKKLIESNDVKLWFQDNVKLPQYLTAFVDDGFEDFETILEIKDKDLVEMKIEKKGHRIKIMKAIQQIKQWL